MTSQAEKPPDLELSRGRGRKFLSLPTVRVAI